MDQLQTSSTADGMLVGVVNGGEIVHLGAYGLYDRRDRTPMRVDQVMDWASISKLVTAIVTWQLIGQGSLTLDTAVGSKIESFWSAEGYAEREAKARITVQQLLSHRSGIRHYTKDDPDGVNFSRWRRHYREARERIRVLGEPSGWYAKDSVSFYKDLTLLKERTIMRGFPFRYSTFGTCVLGAVADAVIKEESRHRLDYYSWAKQRIGDELGMSTFSVDSRYRPSLPGGGWQSNIEDLTQFMIAIMEERFVAIDRLYRNYPGSNYGDGIRSFQIGSNWYYGHGGDQTLVSGIVAIRATDAVEPGRTVRDIHPEKTGVAAIIVHRGDDGNISQRQIVRDVFDAMR